MQNQTMESKHLTSGKRQISKQGVEEVVATQVMLGDLIWVRLNSGLGWPAQVFEILCTLVPGFHKWYLLIPPHYI